MSRIAFAAAVVAAALVPAAGAAASPVGAAHLELRAEVNAQQAQRMVSRSSAAAITAVKHSERSLRHAYMRIAAKSSAGVSVPVSVAAQFTAAADDQAANLAQVVDDGRGPLETVAATALAKTAAMDANVVGSVTIGIDDAQTNPSPATGQQLTELGADQAGLNATLSATASSDEHSAAVQDALDHAAGVSVQAQADLISAVTDLRDRFLSAASDVTASVLSVLHNSGAALVAQLEGVSLTAGMEASANVPLLVSILTGALTLGS